MESVNYKMRFFSHLTNKQWDCIVQILNLYIYWLVNGFDLKKFNFVEIQKTRSKAVKIFSIEHHNRWVTAANSFDSFSKIIFFALINYKSGDVLPQQFKQVVQSAANQEILKHWQKKVCNCYYLSDNYSCIIKLQCD